MIKPLNIATDGYLCDTLSVSSNGYLCLKAKVTPDPEPPVIIISDDDLVFQGGGGGMGTNARRRAYANRLLSELKRQRVEEDKEILIIIKAFLRCL